MSELCLWWRGERGRDHIDTDATLRPSDLPRVRGRYPNLAARPSVVCLLRGASVSRGPIPDAAQSSDVVRLSVVCGVDPQMARLPWRRPRVSAAQGRSPHPLIIHSAPLTTHMMCVCESCAQAYPLP